MILIFYTHIRDSRFEEKKLEIFKNVISNEPTLLNNREEVFILNLRNPPIRKIKNPSESKFIICPVKWLQVDEPGQIIYLDGKRYLRGIRPALGQTFVINGEEFELVGVIPLDSSFIDERALNDLLDEKLLKLDKLKLSY